MPEYNKVIAVDRADFQEIIKTFSDLVHDKFYKSVPYRDYTQLRKYCGEVELRFADNGAVMVVPTESDKSTLWWGKKDDDSFGTFLWGHFQEELQKMHEESKVTNNPYKYDFYDGRTAKSAINDVCSNYDWSGLTYDNGTTAARDITNTFGSTAVGWASTSDTIEKLKTRVEELGKMVKDETADLHERVQEVTRTSAKSLEEAYEEIEARLVAKKVNVSEIKYLLEDHMMDILNGLDEVHADIQMLSDRVSKLEDNSKVDNDRKEKENMDTAKMFNFDFGPVASNIRMSPYGLAMKSADGKYVSYDRETGSVMDVEIFNFDAQKFLYKMPVAVNQVAVGDIVVHMRKPMFVRAVKDGVVSVIDIYNAEAKDILPVKSPFGFNFITKVVSLIDMTGASANSPFGNMLPLLMLGEGQNFKDILPLMLFSNGSMGNMAQNPLMMYALMKDSDGIGDVLPFLMMSQNGLPGAVVEQKCDCGCNNNAENHQ